jgi:hypothetical protein
MIRPGRVAGFAVALVALGLVVWAARADLAWFERHALPDYCVAAVPAWPLHAARVLAVAVALVLVGIVRPRLARMAGGEVAGVALALGLALGAGELILRRVRWEDDHEGGDLPAMRADPRLGWAPAPLQTAGRYVLDAWGDRAAGVVDPTAPTLVVAGESVAFGWRLDWDDTFAAQAGRALGLQVVNVAVPAYGSDQAYLRLADALARLARPRLVVFLFVAREIRRNLSPARPHLVLDGGRLVPAPASPGPALRRLVTDEPYHGDAPLATTRAILVAAADAARARGARPLFVVTNYGRACADDRIARELFAGLPMVRVELGPDEVLAADDPHPNRAGARKLADAIVTARP